jgi:hypothetical protein
VCQQHRFASGTGEGNLMRSSLRVGIGTLVALMGALWTLQGLGYIGGSVMSGSTTWAIIGPIVAVAGIALAVGGARGGGRSR